MKKKEEVVEVKVERDKGEEEEDKVEKEQEKEEEEEEVCRSRGDTTEVAKLHLKLSCGSQTSERWR